MLGTLNAICGRVQVAQINRALTRASRELQILEPFERPQRDSFV